MLQLTLRLALLDTVLLDARRLFKKLAAIFGAGGKNGVNFALIDNGVGTAPDPGIQE